jgi:hypothetical protein
VGNQVSKLYCGVTRFSVRIAKKLTLLKLNYRHNEACKRRSRFQLCADCGGDALYFRVARSPRPSIDLKDDLGAITATIRIIANNLTVADGYIRKARNGRRFIEYPISDSRRERSV